MPPVGERAAVLAALPGDVHQLVEKTGLVESTVRRWLVRMRKAEPKQARVISWKRKNGGMAPRYVAGPGADAPKPKARTQAQYSQKWRVARKAERLEIEAARAEARAHADRAARTPQAWTSALMGAT
jgi:hypothetical protein